MHGAMAAMRHGILLVEPVLSSVLSIASKPAKYYGGYLRHAET